MGKGRERNQPCWCGSGKKYKHCHFNRETETPVPLHEANQEFLSAFSKRKCLAPESWLEDCSNNIGRAHTVSRGASLAKIARDGHVYAFKFDLPKIRTGKGVLTPELTGVRSASTFRGFCNHHDNFIFAPIEKSEFSYTAEQCFLLGYRAISKEQYTKQASFSLSEFRRSADRDKPFNEQQIHQLENSLYEMGERASLADSQKRKAYYDDILDNRSFDRSRAHIIVLSDVPKLMCSGAWFPEKDLDGNKLQDLTDLETYAHTITCNVFANGEIGYIVFQWIDSADEICRRYVQSILSSDEKALSVTIADLIVASIEGVVFAPDWYDTLKHSSKDYIAQRLAYSALPFDYEDWTKTAPAELATAFKIASHRAVCSN